MRLRPAPQGCLLATEEAHRLRVREVRRAQGRGFSRGQHREREQHGTSGAGAARLKRTAALRVGHELPDFADVGQPPLAFGGQSAALDAPDRRAGAQPYSMQPQ